MNFRLNKVIVSMLLVVALIGSVGFFNNTNRVEADTVSSATTKTPSVIIVKPPVKATPVEIVPVITSNYLTLVVDAEDDYMISFDENWLVVDVLLLGETNVNQDMYLGQTLAQVIEEVKINLISENSFYEAVSPIIFGFDPDTISNDEINLLKSNIAGLFDSTPVMLLGIDQEDLSIIKENSLNQFYLAHLEELLRIRTLAEPQYLFVTQSEVFMKALENLTPVMMYKGANELSFTEDDQSLLRLKTHSEIIVENNTSNVTQNVYKYDDDDDHDDDDDDDDDDDEEDDEEDDDEEDDD